MMLIEGTAASAWRKAAQYALGDGDLGFSGVCVYSHQVVRKGLKVVRKGNIKLKIACSKTWVSA